MHKLAVLFFGLMVSVSTFAHEGHDHGPSTVQPQRGGIVRALETVTLELLVDGKTLKIFTFDKAGKSMDTSKFPASLTATLPKKKPDTLKLEVKGDHWVSEFDPKNSHRYDLHLSIKQGGHDDKVKWTVEPKRK